MKLELKPIELIPAINIDSIMSVYKTIRPALPLEAIKDKIDVDPDKIMDSVSDFIQILNKAVEYKKL